MIKVFQDRAHPDPGNCLDAALASALDSTLAEMPQMEISLLEKKSEWVRVYRAYLRPLNLTLHVIQQRESKWLPPPGISVCVLKSNVPGDKNGHAVVCLDGVIIHDPGATALPKIENCQVLYWLIFGVLDPTRSIYNPRGAV